MNKRNFKKGINYLENIDPILKSIINQCGECSIIPSTGYFQSLCEAIISQQLATGAAATICRRFLDYYEENLTPLKLAGTYWNDLRDLGLSEAKVKYVKDLADCCLAGKVNLGQLNSFTDEEIIQQLVQVKGIGKWTAEIFLIFGLGRADVLPADDLGVKKAIQRHYGLEKIPTPREVLEIGAKWKPYRTIAALYLWKSLNNA